MQKNQNKIDLKILTDDINCIPKYATIDSAGADLYANIEENIILKPLKRALIPTGIFLEIPKGYEVQIRPRSGLAYKEGITVLNTPGTIDADYRGEIKVILINLSDKDFIISKKMRIAQMVLCPIYQANFISAKKLALSERGDRGFGHSGKH